MAQSDNDPVAAVGRGGGDHHRVYRITDGSDEAWPDFHDRHLRQDLRSA